MKEFTVLGWRIAPWITRTLPFAIYIAFLIADPVLAQLLSDTGWLYAIKIAVVGMTLAILASSYTELRAISQLTLSDWLLAAASGIVVFVIWINLDFSWATIGESSGFDPRRPNGTIDWYSALIRLFGASIIVPLMEELFWRSFLLRWIDGHSLFLTLAPSRIGIRSLLLSSIVFGFEHTFWIAGILAGLIYGWLYMRKGNLWVPILAHATTNFFLGVWVLYTGNWHFW